MKKFLTVATALMLFTGAFAHDGKKGCCKKDGAKKECCKKGGKTDAKTTKATNATPSKKA